MHVEATWCYMHMSARLGADQHEYGTRAAHMEVAPVWKLRTTCTSGCTSMDLSAIVDVEHHAARKSWTIVAHREVHVSGELRE